MSLKSWKEEFYPVEARDVATPEATDGELLEHSLRKWRGATEENLTRHGLRRSKWRRVELEEEVSGFPDWINFGTATCALCQRYFDVKCEGCPVEVCYEAGRGYSVFSRGGPPDLMIQELEGALLKWHAQNGREGEENGQS